jgi:hypothetical protein
MWSFLTVAVTTIGGLLTLFLTYWTNRQNKKLDQIHILVNGNLDREKRKSGALEKQLREAGMTPITDTEEPPANA